MTSKAQLVHNYIARQLAILRGSQHESAVRASLAHLRRGIGMPPGSLPSLWEITLSGLPEALQSQDGRPTPGEEAIHTALCLYALHQQGQELASDTAFCEGVSLGQALGGLTAGRDDKLERVKRRFDAMATADTLTEATHHLRGLVQLLKQAKQGLDYARLGADLYHFQFETGRNRVRLRWGQDFYAQANRGQKDQDNQESQQTNQEEEV